jgi:hypothetical protein
MKSLTLSESLAEKYCLPTGQHSIDHRMSFHKNAIVRPLSREEMATLNKRVRCTACRLFGASAFETLTGNLRAREICPSMGGTGWQRYPGADHWHVTRADGSTVFRTQNYTALLRYFLRNA